jgi:hypothetical protein
LQRTRRQSLRSFLLAAELDIVSRHLKLVAAVSTLLLGLALGGILALQLYGHFPVFSILAFVLVGSLPAPLAIAIPALAFWLWTPQLFRGEGEVPYRSFPALLALTALSLAWHIAIWRSGLASLPGATLVSATNVAALVVLWLFFAASRRSDRLLLSLLFHFSVGAWALTLGFPILSSFD